MALFDKGGPGLSEWEPSSEEVAALSRDWFTQAADFVRRLPALTAYLLIELRGEERQDPDKGTFALARAAIKHRHAKEATDNTVDRLARELVTHTRAAAVALGCEEWTQAAVALPDGEAGYKELEELAREHAGADQDKPKGGLLPLTELAAAVLHKIGTEGQKQAGKLREDARKRWTARVENPGGIWRPWARNDEGLPRFWLQLAVVTWVDVVRPQLEREERFKAPAVSRAVIEGVLEVVAGDAALEPGERVIVRRKQTVGTLEQNGLALIARKSRLTPGAMDTALQTILERKIGALQSMHGHRLIRALVQWAHQGKLEGKSDKVTVRIDGGLSALARQLGGKSNKAITAVGDALDVLSVIRLPLPGDSDTGHTWLLQWEHLPAKGRRPGEVSVTINWPLHPDGIFRLDKYNRLLTPVPPVAPTLVGRSNEKAAQMGLQLRVMLHFTQHSRELAAAGGIPMEAQTWRQLADESGVSSKLISKIRDVYESPGGGMFPVLTKTTGGLYTLADTAQRELLEEQGRRRQERSRQGHASAEKRKGSKK